MNPKRETRTGEVGAVKADGTLEVLAVAYNVVDDYGSVWAPGVFERSASERLPVIAFGHDWSDPIGRATSFREADEGLYLTARLDVGGAVPRADQAYQQMRPGPNGEAPTLTDVSVGFLVPEGGRRAPTDEERAKWPGVKEVITEAVLDEISVVLRGAVPGAVIMAGSVRDARGQIVPTDSVVAMAKRVHAGELTEAEAKVALALISDEDPDHADVDLPEDDGDVDLSDDELTAEVLAEAENILNRSR